MDKNELIFFSYKSDAEKTNLHVTGTCGSITITSTLRFEMPINSLKIFGGKENSVIFYKSLI